jgi:DNA replication protein DnaC
MFLQGTAGTGKTTIAVNICNEWKIKAPIAHIGAFDFFEILTAAKTFQEQRTAQQEAILWNLQNSRYDLLVIDDFATGRITEAAADVIEIMVRTWEKKGLTVIFTTNVNPDKIVEMFNEQLWSRICGMTAYVELTGNDWRVR